ncbi:hypothetical protein CC86DRAFT_421116 [Ophiobolus disseminans]|uniref:Aminoglycoside phosphotransferase domain-containing protein n=1 Tax=Ophiobolus disseminans TaxID=1469910 RepID=A0A6A6ZW05_9PLEO|nr:hypothetical protein CC86DRAFT_421116 [Ophiobolus disseminans]
MQSHNSPTQSSWVRRHLTLVAIATLKRFRPHVSSVLFLTRRMCVKYGPFQHLSDAAAMQFIASHTSIPVPKTYMKEMRSLKPPNPGVIEGVDGDKLYDMRLQDGLQGFGPFDSIRGFHSFPRGGIRASPDQIPEVNKLAEKHEKAQFSTRFTHGDLNSMNILVKGDSIVGIIDWDTAGWYPEYWEHTTAYNINPYNGFWKDEIGTFLEESPEAANKEQLRQKYFGTL